MKKFAIFGTAIALLMLTSCKEQREGDVTKVPEKTTSLTLTVSLTETVPTPEPVPQDIELAVYNPFANAVKVDNTVKNELLGFAEKLETARQLLQADWRIHDSEEHTDKENVVEVIEDFQYKPFINKDIAQNEDELTKYMRNFFTENYLSDEDIREQLFSDKNTLFGFPPYKTVDGQLCIRCGYDGVMTNISTDDIWVMSYNGNYAEVVMYAYSAADPPPHAFIGFERSDEYGWRLDSLEFKEYNETFVRIYKTAAKKYYTF
nr:hypothetical protein [Oscillospiraceae bacterium]